MAPTLVCPEHTEVPCPTDCMTIREWRALQEKYGRLWRDRQHGKEPRDIDKHGGQRKERAA